MSSILRLISQKIAPKFGLLRGGRKFSTAPPSSPWLMLPAAFEGKEKLVYNFYSPSKGEVVSLKQRVSKEEAKFMQDDHTQLVGSSHGWVAQFNWRNRDLFLSNPISGRRIKLPTPPYSRCSNCYVGEVIISCSPDQEECRAMMVYGPNRLAFCLPGRSNEWTSIDAPRVGSRCRNDTIVYSTALKRFLCVSNNIVDDEQEFDQLECWDIRAAASPTMDWKGMSLDLEDFEIENSDEHVWYLVCGDYDQLYLVRRYICLVMGPDGYSIEGPEELFDRYPHKTVDFCVHKIDSGKSEYMEDSLDGLVMFVGINHSFALRASDFPQFKADSIYFTEHNPSLPNKIYGGHDIGIFDYGNKTCSPLYYPCDVQSFKRIHPVPLWYTPTI